jgi:hypothetical protein
MQEELIYRHIPIASLFAALGVIFPILFHLLGLGSAFLPMFLPVMTGSLLLPPPFAVSVALITPFISFLFTGMPPLFPPILPMLVCELLIVSLISSVFYFKKRYSLWFTLLTALILDRLLVFLFVYLIAPMLSLPRQIFSIGLVVYGLPGIVMIIVVIPFTLNFLEKKYPKILENR